MVEKHSGQECGNDTIDDFQPLCVSLSDFENFKFVQ